MTTCRDHVIYNHMIYVTQGHVTFKPGEPTGGMARRARNTTLYISSEDLPYGIFVFNSCCDPDY